MGLVRPNERFLFVLSWTSSSYYLGYLLHYPLIQLGDRSVAAMANLRRDFLPSQRALPRRPCANDTIIGAVKVRPRGGRKGARGATTQSLLCFMCRPSLFPSDFLFFILASSCPSYIIDAEIRRRGPRMQPASPGLPHLAILPSGAVDTTYKHLMCHRHCQLEDRERGKITGKRNIM